MEQLGTILENYGIKPDSDEGQRILNLIGLIAVRLAKSQLEDVSEQITDKINTAEEDIQRLKKGGDGE